MTHEAAENMKWQPIETAPKDGEWFIARKNGVELLTQWGKTSHVPLYGWCFILSDYGEPEYDLWQPTEWLPLTARCQRTDERNPESN